MNDELKTISVVLAIGSVLSPILFGFILWKVSQVFVSKTSFEEYKAQTSRDFGRIEVSLNEITHSTTELLQRTAMLRKDQ